jgi:hypothetical protein
MTKEGGRRTQFVIGRAMRSFVTGVLAVRYLFDSVYRYYH